MRSKGRETNTAVLLEGFLLDCMNQEHNFGKKNLENKWEKHPNWHPYLKALPLFLGDCELLCWPAVVLVF